MNRTALALAAATIAAIALTGCGATEKTTTVVKTVKDCDALGINSKVGNEGTCTKDGIKFTIVDRDSNLRLEELDAELLKVEKTKTFPDATKPANGTYVIFTLAVTNKTNSPQKFGGAGAADAALLVISNKVYSRNTDAEIALEDSFTFASEDTQPDERRIGKLVFDIPEPAAAKMEARSSGAGNLDIGNFSESLDDSSKRVGAFRLYPIAPERKEPAPQ